MTTPPFALAKISELDAADAITGTELVELAQSGSSRKAALSTLFASDAFAQAVLTAVGELVEAGTYAPTITESPADVTVTAPGGFRWSRVDNVVTIFGTITVDNGAGMNLTGFASNFTLPGGFTASFGVGSGAGFWEDGTRAACFKLNDEGDGFTNEGFTINDGFTSDVRFSFSFVVQPT